MSASLSEAELREVADRLREAGEAVAGPISATLIAGGRSNLTFLLTDRVTSWVLRMPPRVGRTPSAHDVAREFRVTRALHRDGFPVARPVVFEEDEHVLGGPFAVSEFVNGRTIASRADLDARDDDVVAEVSASLVEVLARLHRVDHLAIGLERFGRPDGYVTRQVRRWAGQWEIVGAPELASLAAEVVSLLGAREPSQRSTSVVHGDFRIDNALLEISDRVVVSAVVDWELSTIGDPVADVALMCAYRDPLFDLLLGGPTAWTSNRLPDASQLASLYLKSGGVPLEHWEQHLMLAYFKLAVIAAGIDHRYRLGGTSGDGFDTAGSAVGPLLERARASTSNV